MNADKRLDLRHMVMPLPILEFKSNVKEMAQGMVIEVLIGNEETFEDPKKIIGRSQDRIMNVQTVRDFYKIFIKKERKEEK